MSILRHLTHTSRLWLAALLLTLVAMQGVAQPSDQQRQQRRQQLALTQARHIAIHVPLDEKKTARFVPVYCRKQQEIWNLAPQRRRQGHAENSNDEAEADIEARFNRSEKMLSIRKKYYKEYRRFLTPQEIERVYELERQLMQHMRQNGRRHNP